MLYVSHLCCFAYKFDFTYNNRYGLYLVCISRLASLRLVDLSLFQTVLRLPNFHPFPLTYSVKHLSSSTTISIDFLFSHSIRSKTHFLAFKGPQSRDPYVADKVIVPDGRHHTRDELSIFFYFSESD